MLPEKPGPERLSANYIIGTLLLELDFKKDIVNASVERDGEYKISYRSYEEII